MVERRPHFVHPKEWIEKAGSTRATPAGRAGARVQQQWRPIALPGRGAV
jgi:hypothetical protein